jgi:uncharacterized protein YegP (UPF0339 family)
VKPITETLTARADRWFFYKDKRKKWRWKRKAPNGRIVEASPQGYSRLIDCEKNAKRSGWTGRGKTKVLY